MNPSITRLRELDREIVLLNHVSSLLGWDQETYMPEKGIDERAEQLALIGGMIHEKIVSPEIGRLLEELGVSDSEPKGNPELPELDRDFLRAVYRRYRREVRLPTRLVTELSRETSLAQAVWAKARKENDFPAFAPHLERVIALTREKAELLEYEDEPYDALLDEFEPWMKTASVREIFDRLQPALTDLVERIRNASPIDDAFLHIPFPVELQEAFGRIVLSDLGYGPERGRLDVSAHPFTTTLGGDDVRLTTNYSETLFTKGLFGIIHECGHGLYELGFADELKQSTLADGTSCAIHESQSRFWENIIGRSLPFWRHYYPRLVSRFPENLSDVPLERFYRAVNKVEPSFIRTEADEVTYGLHIILRFRLELELFSGTLSVKDLPERWRSESQTLLGISPATDSEGVLQDIHWSLGAFGYFPTYALGNLYAAQFYAAMRKDLPDLDSSIEAGEFHVPLAWLRKRIHAWGVRRTAEELVREVTGEPLDPSYFMRYLEDKYRTIYDI